MTQTRADYLTRFQPIADQELADRPISVVLPKDLDEYVRALPNRSEWLRQAVAEKMAKQFPE